MDIHGVRAGERRELVGVAGPALPAGVEVPWIRCEAVIPTVVV